MSKPIKNMIVDEYRQRFADVDSAVIIDVRGVKSNENNALRNSLNNQKIRVTVVKNSLAKRAWNETGLEALADLLDGSCAIVYGGDSVVQVARELIDQAKQIKSIEFKGALMEGQLFGPDQIEALSKYPTRDEAQAQVIQLFMSPGSNIAGALVGVGNQIAGILDAVKEKLEAGEEIKPLA